MTATFRTDSNITWTSQSDHTLRENQEAATRARRSLALSVDVGDDDPFSWHTRPVVIETAVFVDQALYHQLRNTLAAEHSDRPIVSYVLTIMNAVQRLFAQSSLAAPLQLSVVLLDILKTQPSVSIVFIHLDPLILNERFLMLRTKQDLKPSDNIDTYLTNFCVWQHNKRRQQQQPSISSTASRRATLPNWDHAILLSGSVLTQNSCQHKNL